MLFPGEWIFGPRAFFSDIHVLPFPPPWREKADK
jgi:hypothetical protein